MNKGNNQIKLNMLFLIGIIFLFGFISYRLVYVAVSPKVDNIDLRAFSESIITESRTIRADRGTIFDINGETLAQNSTSWTVVAFLTEERGYDRSGRPRYVQDKEGTAKALSKQIGMSQKEILNLLSIKGYQVELGPGGRDISNLKKQDIENLDLPGIGFIRGVQRTYPFGEFAPYLIGYARKNDAGEMNGYLGVEGRFNEYLKGTDGKEQLITDKLGHRIANTPINTITEVEDGFDIYLTLDFNIQMYLENTVKKFNGADWVTITIADAKTGAIVGSASSPSFNPNTLSKDMNYNAPLTSYSFEPGSTMKIFSYMAAMENNRYKGTETFQSGSIMVEGYRMRDWNRHGWGKINFDVGFTYSSNIAAVILGQRLGIDGLTDYYEKLGFGQKTGIELPNELAGRLEINHRTELANAAFGQGITTTPIQNIQALTSLTNNGMMLRPYIVDRIVNPQTGEIVFQGERQEVRRVASEKTVDHMLDLMYRTVQNTDTTATGTRYRTDAVTILGKTGTAQIIMPNGQYSTTWEDSIRSFAGIFPKDEPEYIIYVSVQRWRGGHIGANIKSLIEDIATYKNLSERPSDLDETKIVKIQNYINRSRAEVVKDLKRLGLSPIAIGNGEVIIRQSPTKDTSVIAGAKVFLMTNGNEIKMPNVVGWTSAEIISFANMLRIPYTISGYGRVRETSIPRGTVITNQTLNITMDNRNQEEQ